MRVDPTDRAYLLADQSVGVGSPGTDDRRRRGATLRNMTGHCHCDGDGSLCVLQVANIQKHIFYFLSPAPCAGPPTASGSMKAMVH